MSALHPKADIERALIRLVPQENELGTVFGCGWAQPRVWAGAPRSSVTRRSI